MERSAWLGLIAGNSKLHWAQFAGDREAGFWRDRLVKTWDTPHMANPLRQLDPEFPDNLPLYFASVVPGQRELIAAYAQAREMTLADIPLGNLYGTLGIDRALALLGAGDRFGYPVLVIDGGTAITLTGADGDRNLVGGAILPGLQLQFHSLDWGTAALPRLDLCADPNRPTPGEAGLPQRWALTTEGAIASGILQTVATGLQAFVRDWLDRYLDSAVVATGGSGPWIAAQLVAMTPAIVQEPELGAAGWLAWRQAQGEASAGRAAGSPGCGADPGE
jgi:type III pantothenate kinase